MKYKSAPPVYPEGLLFIIKITIIVFSFALIKNKFMTKNNKIFIVSLLIVAAAVAGWWYYGRGLGKNQEKTAFETGFTLLDDEAGLVWSENTDLDQKVREQFEKKAEAIKTALSSAKEKDELLGYYNDLAIYENYLGNYRESYSAYLESLKLESQARVTWQNFADVLLKMKAYKSAEMAYKKAVDLNKYIPESYTKLADYYKVTGDGAKVEETYKTAIETIKESMESDTLVLDAYAEWLAGEKRYDEAEGIYRQLIVKQPNNKEAIERKIEMMRK